MDSTGGMQVPRAVEISSSYSSYSDWQQSRSYLQELQALEGVCQLHGLVKEAHLMLYMQNMGECTRYKAVVEEAYNALAWAHHMGNQLAPTESAAVKLHFIIYRGNWVDQSRRRSQSMLKFWPLFYQTQSNPTHWLIFVWRQLA